MKKRYPKCKQWRRVQTRQPARHTHSTSAGLEDALAAAWDIIHEYESAMVYIEARTRNLVSILQQTREGPHSYDQERAAGLRITVRKR